jgi:hypothetical protein
MRSLSVRCGSSWFPSSVPRTGLALDLAAEADPGLVCTATAEGTPGGVLERVARAIGIDGAEQRALRVRWSGHVVNDFQSDRSYEPFFSLFQAGDAYFDSQGGGLATRSRGGAYVGSELPSTPFILLGGPWPAWVLRDTLVRPAGNGADMRHTNPWAAVHDFIHAGEAQLEGRCVYRDYHASRSRAPESSGPSDYWWIRRR